MSAGAGRGDADPAGTSGAGANPPAIVDAADQARDADRALDPARRGGEPAPARPPMAVGVAPGTRALRIGITGPIGCGKSTVAGWLEERGGAHIDADEVGRSVMGEGEPAAAAVLARFGPAVAGPDGTIDRAALARIVFSDAAALRDLEAIVHPAVRVRILDLLATAESAGAPFVVIEAIKLVEGGLAALCDEVWVVECGPSAQLARLEGRGASREDAERRIAAQGGDLAERLRPHATRSIDTDGSSGQVRRLVLAALDAALGGRDDAGSQAQGRFGASLGP